MDGGEVGHVAGIGAQAETIVLGAENQGAQSQEHLAFEEIFIAVQHVDALHLGLRRALQEGQTVHQGAFARMRPITAPVLPAPARSALQIILGSVLGDGVQGLRGFAPAFEAGSTPRMVLLGKARSTMA